MASPWHEHEIGILLSYPDREEVGKASLGLATIARAASIPGTFIDYLFLDDGKNAFGNPRSAMTGAPPRVFSIIGFNCSFEMNYSNIVDLLHGSSIPPNSRERAILRSEGHHVPWIVAGGIAISSNPFPMLPYFDFIFIRDAEITMHEFVRKFTKNLHVTEDMAAWWNEMGKNIHGIIPAFLFTERGNLNDIFNRSTCHPDFASLDSLPVPESRQLLGLSSGPPSVLGSAYFLEIGRGCGESCRFCTLSHHYRPPRFRSLSRIKEILDRIGMLKPQVKKILLIGSNVADHPHLGTICREIRERGYDLSFPSLHPENLDGTMIDILSTSGIHTLTIAPETGSDRLRHIAGKNISNERYIDFAGKLTRAGIKNLKVYILQGLPMESVQDIDETVTFITSIQDSVQENGSKITLSINAFIPKLGTPFMFHTRNFQRNHFGKFKKRYKKFVGMMNKLLKGNVKAMSIRLARIQAALSLGGTEISCYLDEGPITDGTPRVARIPEDVVESILLEIEQFQYREELPGHISCVLPTGFPYLKKQWLDAKEGIPVKTCSGFECDACQACGISRHEPGTNSNREIF